MDLVQDVADEKDTLYTDSVLELPNINYTERNRMNEKDL